VTGTNPHTQTHGKELINTMAQAVKYLIGDTREQIATIADGSVSLVACSPPTPDTRKSNGPCSGRRPNCQDRSRCGD